MFDKFLNSIIHDTNTRMYVGTAIIIYIACLTDMIPNKIKKVLKEPIVKMLVLASIAYLSTINFEGALMVTIIYFATANCMSYEENFNNLLSRDSAEPICTPAPYLVKSMREGIRSYNDDRTLNEQNRINLKRWGKAAETNSDDPSLNKPAGQCYKDTASSAVDAATVAATSAWDNVVGLATGNTGEGFTEHFTDVENNRCGTGLAPVAECAADDGNLPYVNGVETFPACGAAFAKWQTKECKWANGNNQCLESDGGAIKCADGPLAEDCSSDYTTSVIKPFTSSTDGSSFEGDANITLDHIKNTYLKNIVDQNMEIGTDQGPHKQNNDNKYIYSLTQELQNQIERLNDPVNTVANDNGKDLKYKLNSTYRYLYKFSYAGPLPSDSEYNDETFDIPETIIDIYIIDRSVNPPIELNIDEITAENKNTYFDLDNGEYKYYPKLNPDYAEGSNDNKYITEDGEETNDEDSAAHANHPRFISPVYETITRYETYDIYNRYKPFTATEDIIGLAKALEATQGSGAADDALAKYENKSIEVDAQREADTAAKIRWDISKAKWENETAKKIMRSIGCHRLRDPDTHTYGYWGNSGTKSPSWQCIYENKV
jgi:hypothetical protein